MWKAIQLDVEIPNMAVPPQKSAPTLCQYARRQKGTHGNILKCEEGYPQNGCEGYR